MREGSCGELADIRDLGQALVQVGAGELPVDCPGAVSHRGFEVEDARRQLGERGRDSRGEDLALEDREVDLDLIDPAGVDGRVDQEEVGVAGTDALDRLLALVGGAVVDDQEDPSGGAVEVDRHDLVDQAHEGLDAGLELDATEGDAQSDVPGGEVLDGAGPRVVALDVARLARTTGLARSGSGHTAQAGLDAGLLVGADDVVIGPQGVALEDELVEVQDHLDLGHEVGIARVHPARVLPGLERVGLEDALDAADADRDSFTGDDLPDAGGAVPAQGQAALAGQLAGDGDHQRPHPLQESPRTPASRRISEREPLLHPAPPPLAHPRGALAQAPRRLRAAQVGLFIEQEHEPSPLHFAVRKGLRAGPGLGLGDLGRGEARLVQRGRATVPRTTGRGRRLYRRQRRVSVGRIGCKSNLPTDAPFFWLPPAAARPPRHDPSRISAEVHLGPAYPPVAASSAAGQLSVPAPGHVPFGRAFCLTRHSTFGSFQFTTFIGSLYSWPYRSTRPLAALVLAAAPLPRGRRAS